MGDYKNCVNFCSLSLEENAHYEKPLVNRADGYFQLEEFDKAVEDYKALKEAKS